MNRKERRAARKLNKTAAAPPPRREDGADIVAALLGQGRELLAAGQDEAALELACRVIAMAETPDSRAFFVQCVKGWSYFPGAEAVQGTLARAVREAWTWPTQLLVPVLGILQRDPAIGPALRRTGEAWPRRLAAVDMFGPAGLAAVADHPLLLAVLETLQVPDLAFERLLTAIRGAVLDIAAREGAGDDRLVRLAAALAQQCCINEYVFDVTAAERELIGLLEETIRAALAQGRPLSLLRLAAFAAYARLDAVPAKALSKTAWPASLSGLIDQQVAEPIMLDRQRASIRTITPITDSVSQAVRHQYEENPYPRWIRSPAATAAVDIDADLRREFPWHNWSPRESGPQLDILIAGCGTGQQSIDFAQRYQGAKVLAVDLSLSSLAYAKARTEAAGLTNIEYAQADILELGQLGRRFDAIVSSGVLHHLAAPLAGWRVLTSLLRPGGFMYIGLYSELARRGIVAARQWIAAHGYPATADGIRAARQELARVDDPAWRSIFTMIDFYSTSECRDLLFHVQEHRFTLPQIADFLHDNDLRLLGFAVSPKIARQFRARFPAEQARADIGLWHQFETEHPDTFIAMYQFWVQKLGVQ